jgi:hypothetical protein
VPLALPLTPWAQTEFLGKAWAWVTDTDTGRGSHWIWNDYDRCPLIQLELGANDFE